jgi:putative ABC transport system permease protein
MFSGAFRERLLESWLEIRENMGRSVLQTLGVMVGVASVLGGFSISDSFSRHSQQLYIKQGGLDKLNVLPSPVARDGRPTAMQTANLGLRTQDSEDGEQLDRQQVAGVSERKNARARVRSAFADQERMIWGVNADAIPMDGYSVQMGRTFSRSDYEQGNPVAVLGYEVADTFFPHGNAVGSTLTIGAVPVTVIGVFQERIFRFRNGDGNAMAWRNRLVTVPAALVQKRLNGDMYRRLDRVTFRLPKVEVISEFSKKLGALLRANHRMQEDFRLDDVAARVRRMQSQGDVYNIVFMLSGILALVGGGIVNVNIQLASLKERVREVGVKMAIGAPGPEIFKSFITEAMLLSLLGALMGFIAGVAFSWIITHNLEVALYMNPASFLWALVLAVVFGFLFALYPARKASKLSPMEALRYE